MAAPCLVSPAPEEIVINWPRESSAPPPRASQASTTFFLIWSYLLGVCVTPQPRPLCDSPALAPLGSGELKGEAADFDGASLKLPGCGNTSGN